MKTQHVKTDKGYFSIDECQDSDYPGVDIEFVANNDTGENMSRPRVLFEFPKDGELRVLVWTDKDSEDYTNEITFKI